MQCTPSLLLALLTPFVLAWSTTASAVSCTNGKTLYNKTTATQALSCSNSQCHKADLSANRIQNGALGAGGANAINNALDNVSEMTGVRANLALTAADLDDLAQWIFFAPTCPSAAPSLSTSPSGIAFGSIIVGQSSAPLLATLTNSGSTAATGLAFISSNAVEFIVTGNTCGATVNAGASCTFNITYRPSAAGADSATLTINAAGGVVVVMALSAAGTADLPPPPPPSSATVDLIEYFHAEFGHYFITYLTDEITKLDNGTFKGWARTGKQFKAWTAGGANMVPVCRFFTVAFAPKSSHFYTPFAPECIIVKANTVWTYEGEVFFTQQASVTGVCPASTVPVYRMYNNGQSGAPNHRYTTDLNVRTKMLAEGWIAEGAGAIGVIMCSPP